MKKKLHRICKNFAKSCCKKICKIFADFSEFLQLHILQKVLQFRPREESVRGVNKIVKKMLSNSKKVGGNSENNLRAKSWIGK